jgi:hypothetical protein
MARQQRLEKCNICNSLRLTQEVPRTSAGPPLKEPESSQNRGSDSGGIILHSSSEFRID